MAADVYAVAPHTGRGGWTWYTGSAGWMYRLILESLLGLRLEVDRLDIAPRLPAHWNELKIYYRFRETLYHECMEEIKDGENDKTDEYGSNYCFDKFCRNKGRVIQIDNKKVRFECEQLDRLYGEAKSKYPYLADEVFAFDDKTCPGAQ